MMFQILIIQNFFDMSNEKTEQGLNVNILYMLFVGLSIED
jgi:transposase